MPATPKVMDVPAGWGMVRMVTDVVEPCGRAALPVSPLMPTALMMAGASPWGEEWCPAGDSADSAGERSGVSRRTSLWSWFIGATLGGAQGGRCFEGCPPSPGQLVLIDRALTNA